MLHELLAGAPPFGRGSVAEVLRRAQEQEPAPPAGAGADLATIVATGLAKDPAARYPSALARAEDLERWLDHRPIAARPATRSPRLRLLCRRSPVAASLAIAVALLTVALAAGAIAASLVLQRRLEETRDARLCGHTAIEWRDRGHFYAAVAEAMRRVLIDHARAGRARASAAAPRSA